LDIKLDESESREPGPQPTIPPDQGEVAEIMGRPLGTVKRWMSEARQKLKREWEGGDGEKDP
jgi:hypothetical protein